MGLKLGEKVPMNAGMRTFEKAKARPARVEEAAVLRTLIRASFKDVVDKFKITPHNWPAHPAFIETAIIRDQIGQGGQYYILDIDQVPGGCVLIRFPAPRVWVMENLCILPRHRHQGLGAGLVGYVLNHARHCGAQKISIVTIDHDWICQNWFRAMGFVECGARRFEHIPFRLAFMTLDLAG